LQIRKIKERKNIYLFVNLRVFIKTRIKMKKLCKTFGIIEPKILKGTKPTKFAKLKDF